LDGGLLKFDSHSRSFANGISFENSLQIKKNRMKKIALASLALCIITFTNAQSSTTEITKRNSWLKLGANLGLPTGNAGNYSALSAGVELKGQLMETRNLGIGLTTGYNLFFPKSGYKGFGTLPLGAFIRVYPEKRGFFAGIDGGYSFITEVANATGGVYVRPQIGYHNFDWNIFGFYNNIFRNDLNGRDIGTVGIGATYNLRFR
jgi:hypothetical protein